LNTCNLLLICETYCIIVCTRLANSKVKIVPPSKLLTSACRSEHALLWHVSLCSTVRRTMPQLRLLREKPMRKRSCRLDYLLNEARLLSLCGLKRKRL